jgi:hypothetical protein
VTTTPPTGTARTRRVDPALAVASLLIAGLLVLIVLGFNAAVTGRDAMNLPEAIESIDPGDGDRVLRQTRLFVDFATGYEGTMLVNGVEIPVVRIDELTAADGTAPQPGEQVVLPPVAIYDPGNATLVFQPTEGAPIESLSQGTHEVTVVYWRIEDGRERSRQFSWTFRVD